MSKTIEPKFNPFGVKLNKHSNIKKVVAVVSGKGGVGKSMVSGMLANTSVKHGYFTGLLDADVTGPSIGRMFGINQMAYGDEHGNIYPAVTERELKVISANMLLEDEEKAVMWRGIMINNAVKDFYGKVLWGDLDVLFIDMPPGTGDVPLTVYQSLPIDGIVMVTTPQDLVGMIVAKAIDMAHKMNIPILGVIENMSYMECDDCGKRIYPFGQGTVAEYAKKHDLEVLASLPIDPKITQAANQGTFDTLDIPAFDEVTIKILKKLDIYEGIE